MAPRSGEATLAYSQFMNTVHPRLEVYGHTHSNAYRIVRNEDGSVRVAYITGSVVPDNHYPMFRRYFFNLTSQTVLNYETYYLNLTRQQTSNSFIGYELLYSARQAYGLPDLSPFSWVDLTRRMQTNQTLFQLYCNHMAPPQTECDQKGTLCDIDEIYC
jgi:sphingomyelin phosphodiesterase